jgi:hypothetical protein
MTVFLWIVVRKRTSKKDFIKNLSTGQRFFENSWNGAFKTRGLKLAEAGFFCDNHWFP